MRRSSPGPLAVQSAEGQASAPEIRYLKANGQRAEPMGSWTDRVEVEVEVEAVKVGLLQMTDVPPYTLMMLCTVVVYNLG